jgi:hypothetical protein
MKPIAILIPTAHDEPPIFARFFDDFFALPRALICSTNEELQFVQLAQSGKHYVVQHYSWERIISVYTNVFDAEFSSGKMASIKESQTG